MSGWAAFWLFLGLVILGAEIENGLTNIANKLHLIGKEK